MGTGSAEAARWHQAGEWDGRRRLPGKGGGASAALRKQRDGGHFISVRVSKGSVVVPWHAVPGTGRGTFGASLPQSLPLKAKPPGYVHVLCPEGRRLSQTLHPSAAQKLPEWDCVRSSVRTFVGRTGAH